MFNTQFDEKTKIWGSCDIPPVLNPNISIGNIVLKSLKTNGSKIAQVRLTIFHLIANKFRK